VSWPSQAAGEHSGAGRAGTDASARPARTVRGGAVSAPNTAAAGSSTAAESNSSLSIRLFHGARRLAQHGARGFDGWLTGCRAHAEVCGPATEVPFTARPRDGALASRSTAAAVNGAALVRSGTDTACHRSVALGEPSTGRAHQPAAWAAWRVGSAAWRSAAALLRPLGRALRGFVAASTNDGGVYSLSKQPPAALVGGGPRVLPVDGCTRAQHSRALLVLAALREEEGWRSVFSVAARCTGHQSGHSDRER
jgi:hypothetical protein